MLQNHKMENKVEQVATALHLHCYEPIFHTTMRIIVFTIGVNGDEDILKKGFVSKPFLQSYALNTVFFRCHTPLQQF